MNSQTLESKPKPLIPIVNRVRGKYQSESLLQRQSRILAVARDIIATSGYEGLTMRTLAEQAGVSKKTLYNQYSGKDDLVLAATTEVLENIATQVASVEPGISRIVAREQAIYTQVMSTPEYALAMTQALLAANPQNSLIEVLINESIVRTQVELRHARKKKELNDNLDELILARSLVSQSWGVLMLWSKQCIPLTQIKSGLMCAQLNMLVGVSKGLKHTWLKDTLSVYQREAAIKPNNQTDKMSIRETRN
ncbi:MAG: AcrR family transcriptional regulator [Patiriisocius sp.]|jgi:AcrR family transcriptional regulator